MKKHLCLTIIFLLITVTVRAITDTDNMALADSISDLVKNYSRVTGQKTASIDSMKALRASLSPGEDRIRLGEKLGRSYLTQNLDSALMYWRLSKREAEETGHKDLAIRMNMHTLAAMPLQGIAIEALEEFARIDTTGFSHEMKHLYWLNKSELYFNIQRPYPEGKQKNHYRMESAIALDSLLRYYPVDSPVSGFITAYLHDLRDENNLAAASFTEVMPSLVSRPVLYDFAISNVVDFYRDKPGYRSLYLNNLYRQVVHELQNGTPRADVLGEAGQALYDEGNATLGRQLLMLALQTGGDHLGPYSDLDHATYSAILYQNTAKAQIWTILVIFVLLILIVLIIIRQRHYKTLAHALRQQNEEEVERHKTAVADMRKVSANLLSMALFTDEQLKEYNLHVLRKLKAGQVKELSHEVQSGEYIQSLNDKFFAMFDESFLSSFPGFVDSLNRLFSPGRDLSLLPGRRMSPELRIAAFMRLGINDSTRLAQVLGLSINTIYTYRNRLKGRAIDRVNFDKNVQEIVLES